MLDWCWCFGVFCWWFVVFLTVVFFSRCSVFCFGVDCSGCILLVYFLLLLSCRRFFCKRALLLAWFSAGNALAGLHLLLPLLLLRYFDPSGGHVLKLVVIFLVCQVLIWLRCWNAGASAWCFGVVLHGVGVVLHGGGVVTLFFWTCSNYFLLVVVVVVVTSFLLVAFGTKKAHHGGAGG